MVSVSQSRFLASLRAAGEDNDVTTGGVSGWKGAHSHLGKRKFTVDLSAQQDW